MVGRTLDHYEILEPLGAGGMGEVYRARDITLKRDVAIKVLPEDLSSEATSARRPDRRQRPGLGLHCPIEIPPHL
jgi:serine/threonine protein kinase